MLVVRDVPALRAAIAAARARGERVAFVPTMGALHAGHLSLLQRGRAQAECVVLSIFVNPLQFAPTEDLAKYPRTEQQDLDAAAAEGTTIAFVPSVDVMYAAARAVTVTADAIADQWEGAIRPGHFAGVLTVVAKLFNLVQPDIAIFGQKDLQQVTVLQAMVRDLDFPVAIDVAPIVREHDGLAMSSRNRYLAPSERVTARCLSRALATMSQAFDSGERDASRLIARGEAVLHTSGVYADYLTLVDAQRLDAVTSASTGSYAMLAARVGATRLLDNHRLGEPFPAFT